MFYNFTRKFSAVICIFVICLLVSIKIACAQAHIANAHLTNVHLFSDPCAGQSVGGACTDGAIYAGTGYSSGGLNPALRYMVTPAGCPNETCSSPSGTDTVTKEWANGSGTTGSGDTGAQDADNGKLNTAILVNYSPFYTDTDAAHWCTSMNFGGYANWYLPSLQELNYVLYNNRAALGGFQSSNYWSSTEVNEAPSVYDAFYQLFNATGQLTGAGKTTVAYVRCIRSY